MAASRQAVFREADTGKRALDRAHRHALQQLARFCRRAGLLHLRRREHYGQRPGAKKEVVAENKLGEYCYASPAISQGQIYFRGEKHLYAIGQK